ncbi:mucin-2 [Tribolium castaneum]|nr:PREDICTED: mucin-5AC [Tribolium castaneum]|eukprot:XP_008198760.1 PREDICTED: mucin-5AC [Tribolium castaneum]
MGCFLTVGVLFSTLCLFAAGQEYIITGPADTQFIPNYRQTPDFNPFRPNFQHVDSYLPQRDLQTSHLPYHLQQTLPQYRATTKTPPRYSYQPQFDYRSSQPAPFRTQEQIVPSTHRPNYSNLFPHSHRNPQTETFLGEITLQSPEDFKQEIDTTEKSNVVTIGGRGNFLNHRTRIFAPDTVKKVPLVREYYVNKNGNVFSTTRAPITQKTTTESLRRKTTSGTTSTTIESTTRRSRNGLDFESLLEEPIKNSNTNDDVVEVVKSKSVEMTTLNSHNESTTDFDYDTTLDPSVDYDKDEGEEEEEEDPIKHLEELRKQHPEEEDYVSEEEETPNSEETNNVRDEDYEEEEGTTTSTVRTTSSTTPSTIKTTIATPSTIRTTDATPSTTTEEVPTTRKTEALLAEPETVISVVTTKSVVNNTILPTATPLPNSTITSENSTDTWVVVASVQTSRSVSGARYLPSDDVKQDERIKLLNEESTESTETTDEPMTVLPTTKHKTSTESLIDKLDRVQSDLSSSVFNGGLNNIAVITEMATTTPPPPKPVVQIRKFSPFARPSTTPRTRKIEIVKQDDLTGLLPPGFKPKYQNRKTTVKPDLELPQGDEPPKIGRSSGISNKTKITVQDVSPFLPPGYKSTKDQDDSTKLLAEILGKVKPKIVKVDDVSAFLPPGYKPTSGTTSTSTTTTKSVDGILSKAKPVDDISALLPPGYKSSTSTTKPKPSIEGVLAHAKPVDDISALLPPGYKPSSTAKPVKPKGVDGLLAQAKPVDISAFLPPGYKARTTQKPLTTPEKVPSSLLPPGYKLRETTTTSSTTSTTTTTTSKPSGFKIVFPSRPGGTHRKSPNRITTPPSTMTEEPRATAPTIHKGWPSRATTEFTGWPTPSTTPISIEKLLEAARTAATSTTPAVDSTTSTTTSTTTTTTTTTPKPTTPGVCTGECDLAGTIKLVGGAKWVPELLDRNTKEWQILANEVQTQLEDVFGRSNVLNKWYRKIRIDGFSEGSVLVDYLVELNDLGRKIDTQEIKKLFHDSLDDGATNREGKSLNETSKMALGKFTVDPKFTDFVVLPKQVYPTVGYAEDNVLLPQWAIAVIVIGLASLLFVIIFGVTVLVNRQKNAKKKAPVSLTEDMLNELNKNHMGGFDNYGADDLYNMEDVWNDRGFEPKLAKKRSSGSLHDNSMSNLYDSWRSEWNGYYYNAYYGNNNPGSSSSHYGRRRSDYDTNF